jgi:ABC-2 type transport system ATP-binding protein
VNPPARISLRNVCKGFRSAPAVLKSVTLEIGAGQVFALLGPNGTGKTTLVRIIATLLLPDSGEIRVEGRDALREPLAVRRLMGCSLDSDRSFFMRLSARENLLFFAAMQGFGSGEASRQTAKLLEAFGLAAAARQRVQEFSSGMKQKLSLARAMLADPPVLILDEPTRGLDPVAAMEFRGRVRELAKTSGKTVLLVTHSIEEAAELADAAGILASGRLTVLDGDWRVDLPARYNHLAAA